MHGMGMKAGRDAGFSVIYLIAALAVAAGIATAVTVMTPSSTMTGAQENRFGQAYYAAYSGVQYLKYAEGTSQPEGGDAFVAAVNAGSPYALDDGTVFDISVTAISSAVKGQKFEYKVNYIKGTVGGEDASSSASYIIASGMVRSIDVPSHGGGDVPGGEYVLASYGGEQHISQNVNIHNATSLYGRTGVYLDQGVSFLDSIAIISGGETHISQNVRFYGFDNTICSDGDVNFDQGVVYRGKITATGGVYFSQNNQIYGDVYVVNGSIVGAQGLYVEGNFNARGDVRLSQNTQIRGNIYAFGNIYCSKHVYISGVIYQQNGATVSGCSANKSLLPSGYSVSNECSYNVETPTLKLINTPSNTSPALAKMPPGTYGNIKYDQNSTNVTFSSGKYYINSLQFDQGGSMCLDLRSGSIDIYVKNNVHFSQNFSINVIEPGSSSCVSMAYADPSLASNVYLEVQGNFEMDQGGMWFGRILAKDALHLSQNTRLIGSYASLNDSPEVDQGAVIQYVKPN